MDSEKLASSLEQIAELLAINPSPIVGMKVVASSDGKGGNVTGVKVTAIGGSGAGKTTGMNVSVTGGQRNPLDAKLIEELQGAAAAVRAGTAPQSWISSLLDRLKELGNRAIDAAVDAAVKAAAGG